MEKVTKARYQARNSLTRKHECSAPSTPEPPLAGIHVLELAQGISGPFYGKLLAEYGAELIKLEPLTDHAGRS